MTRTMTSHTVDTRELRNALGSFATGVAVITTLAADGTPVGVTANSFASVSLDPPMILWMPGRHLRSLDHFRSAGRFAVSVLAKDQAPLSRRFSTPGEEKFQGLSVAQGLGGIPLIEDALATFEASTATLHEAGDHCIILGNVERFSYRAGEPLVFHGGAYCDLLAS
ncbi:flavin reductase family protein [Glutamicibacter sp. MNS18]|uniref:flavin reductase family protein n=1 Tax=Glutamicibacter sp. MNS18 TaxID=2989817 RepID=UPI002235D2D7|nr:flavin reductase family protein [Glutamicibacter sp. MNS18]MCW4467219.1 flavin reductase family protein [Glutamicibacter sp. MNS18]